MKKVEHAMTQALTTVTLLLALLATQSAHAYPIEKYIGIASGIGWTDTEFRDPSIDAFGLRETPSYSDVKNPSTPWSMFAGLRFHPNYGVELSYVSFSRIEFEKTLEQRENNTGKLTKYSVRDASIHASGISLNHVIYLPLFWNLNLAAKAGVLLGDVKYHDKELLQTPRDSADGSELVTSRSQETSTDSLSTAHFALALNWRPSKDWSSRWQLEQVKFKNDGEKETFTQWYSSLALQYHF